MPNKFTAPEWVNAWATIGTIQHQLNSLDGFSILLTALQGGEILSRRTGTGEIIRKEEYLSDDRPSFRGEVEVNRASLFKWLKQHEPAVITGAKRGPKASYDWDRCWAHLCRHVHENGTPTNWVDLNGVIKDWFVEKVDGHPGDTEIKKRVRLLRDEFSR